MSASASNEPRDPPGPRALPAPAQRTALATAPPADPYTAMTPRFGRLAGAFGRRFFAGFHFEADDAAKLLEREQQGAVVYVMRYSSRLDYFLFNWLFVREGLRLSSYANGIRFYYYRPLGEALRLLFRGALERVRRGYRGMRRQNKDALHSAVVRGQSLFLFLRTDKIRSRLSATRRGALASGRSEADFLGEVVDTCAQTGLTVHLVPLALFWRKGVRAQRRFLNLFYGAPERPTDTGKVLSFLWNYRNLAVRVGTPIDLGAFLDEQREQPLEELVSKVRRTLLIFLRREEKPIAGPALAPFYRVEERVLGDAEVRAAIAEAAKAAGRSPERLEARARRMLAEIAAQPSPSMLAVLDVLVTRIFGRLFERIEVHGLDGIADAAKQYPLVLVPCHRSHFDYLLLSWLFYERHLVPPMVAAGVNLSFWPLGPIFRRAGGFFLRRSFEGDRLYTAVFRRYVQQLIKDGTPQEFFIEGTRSRTGRTLPPRTGMLSMVLEAWARGVRRDVFLVPIGFAYERLVEERALVEERTGARKARENLLALVRARSVLRQRYGSVVVRFGEPILLSEAVGAERALLASEPAAGTDSAEARAARRALVERVGLDVCRRVSGLVAATRTALASAALLSTPARGVLDEDLAQRVRALVDLLEAAGVPFAQEASAALARGDFASLLEPLVDAGLVSRSQDGARGLVHFDEQARHALDYYRATLAHALAPAGAAALALLAAESPTREQALAEAARWLDLLRLDVLPPPEAERQIDLERILERFAARGWIEESAERLAPTADGRQLLPLVAAQIRPALEAYRAVFEVVLEAQGSGTRAGFERDALAAIRRHLLVGEAVYAEAACPAAQAQAIPWLLREGMLATRSTQPAKGAAVPLEPGPRFGELKRWQARVAAAASSR